MNQIEKQFIKMIFIVCWNLHKNYYMKNASLYIFDQNYLY